MKQAIEILVEKAISCEDIEHDGRLTSPRSYGVYQIPEIVTSGRMFRYGNHPVRQLELQREFGDCSLVYLFLEREYAFRMQQLLNKDGC